MGVERKVSIISLFVAAGLTFIFILANCGVV